MKRFEKLQVWSIFDVIWELVPGFDVKVAEEFVPYFEVQSFWLDI